MRSRLEIGNWKLEIGDWRLEMRSRGQGRVEVGVGHGGVGWSVMG